MRPILLWGLDPAASSFVQELRIRCGSPAPDVFAPGAAADADVVARVSEILEKQRAGATRPGLEVVALGTAFLPGAAASIDMLRETCARLHALHAGQVAATLALLVPPAAAPAGEREAGTTCLRQVEGLLGSLPVLDMVWINRVSQSACRAICSDPPQVVPDPETIELLYWEVVAAAVRPLVEQGRAQFPYRLRAGSEKRCFATAGVVEYSWPPHEVIRHIDARLKCWLVFDGLMDPDSIAEDGRKLIVERARDFLAERINGFQELVPVGPPAPGPLTSGDPERAEKAASEQWDAIRAILDRSLGGYQGCAEKALIRFLDDAPPGNLAGADDFLSLIGAPGALEAAFCGPALRDAMLAFFDARLKTLPAAPGGSGPSGSEEDGIARCGQVLGGLAAASGKMDETQAVYVDFLRRAFVFLAGVLDTGDEDPATLVQTIVREYASATRVVHDRARAAAENWQTAAEATQGGGFLSALFRRSKRAARLAEVARLREEAASLQEGALQLGRCLAELLAEVVLPDAARRHMCRWLAAEVESAGRKLRDFEAGLRRAAPVPGDLLAELGRRETSIQRTAVDGALLDLLFEAAGGTVSAPAHVRSLLRFSPEFAIETPSYQRCHGLGGHFQAGYKTLVDRIGDYAASCCAPLGRLDLIHACELKTVETASLILEDMVQRSRRFLEMQEGALPRLRNEGGLTEEGVMWIRGGRDRLGAAYQNLKPEIREGSDPHRIRIVTFFFGLPCSVLRFLHEPAGQQFATI